MRIRRLGGAGDHTLRRPPAGGYERITQILETFCTAAVYWFQRDNEVAARKP